MRPNVGRFFSDTLRIRPKEVQKRCALFYEGEWKDANTYHYCVIIVENSDEDLQVTFYITDDREMNWVNEFLDGPFFDRSETEKLFGLLHGKAHVRMVGFDFMTAARASAVHVDLGPTWFAASS